MDIDLRATLALKAELEDRNIELKVEGENLKLKIPSGCLHPDLRSAITAHKHSLLDLLKNKPIANASTPVTDGQDPDDIPESLRQVGTPCATCGTTDWWIPRPGMIACSQCHPYLRPGRLVASLPHDDEDLIEAYEERAAIMEYEGGMPRLEAEFFSVAAVTHTNQPTNQSPELHETESGHRPSSPTPLTSAFQGLGARATDS